MKQLLFVFIAVWGLLVGFTIKAAKLSNPSSLSLPTKEEVVCCECVDFHLCVNGSINFDGHGLLNLRLGGPISDGQTAQAVNVEICPDILTICCEVPNPDKICVDGLPAGQKQAEYITAPADANCECIGYNDCDHNLVVSDGKGLTSIRLSNGREVSHSKCDHALDVCCFLPDLFIENYTLPSQLNECECVAPSLCGPDGHIITSGVGVIAQRFGPVTRQVCPTDPKLVCCLPPKLVVEPEEECECVQPPLCGPDGHIIKTGVGVINERFGGIKRPKVCPSNPNLVCCLPPKSIDVSVTTPFSEIGKRSCECVQPTLCGLDGKIITDGEGLINVRIGPVSPVDPCPYNSSLVCCYPPDDSSQVTPFEPTPIITPTPSVDNCECVDPILCGPDGHIRTDGAPILNVRFGAPAPPLPCPTDPNLVCCLPPKSKPVITTTVAPLPPPQCGQRNFNGLGVRILGFQEGQAQFGEFPWVVSILRYENLNENALPFFVGGGSLIHLRIILTAAHKVIKADTSKMWVRLGDWDTASMKEALLHQEIKVIEKVIHPHYTPGSLFHDVALLILSSQADSSYHINPICIAKSLDEIDPSYCIANGWGSDGFRTENYQKIMKSIVLPLVNKPHCQNLLRKTQLSRYFELHHSFLCAGGEEGKDACKGDGGGPLACPMKNDPSRYLQVGVTAWGVGCGEKDVPGVYADVLVEYDWIQQQMEAWFPLELELGSLTYDQEEFKKNERKKRRRNRRRKNRRRNRNKRRRS